MAIDKIKFDDNKPDEDCEESDYFWGFLYKRDPRQQDNTVGLSFSDFQAVTLSGRGELWNGYKDVIHINSHNSENKLRQFRSRLRFVVQCGEEISEAYVSKLTLSDVANSCYWNPRTRDFEKIVYDNDVTVFDCEDSKLCEDRKPIRLPRDPVDGKKVTVSLPYPEDTKYTDVTDANGSFIYMLSQKLDSDRDSKGNHIHTLPVATIYFRNGARYSWKLGHDLDPHKYYIYTLTLNNIYLSVELTVQKWDDVKSSSDEIIDPPTLTVGTFAPDGWDNGGTSIGVIN